VAGQLGGERASALDAFGGVMIAEIDLDFVIEESKSHRKFREIERFPAITRDIAMIVPDKTTHEEIERAIRDANEPLLASVGLFDLFESAEISGVGPARKSLAYTLTYRDKNRTLTSEEVAVTHAKIRERLQRDLGAELRE
jgi:phenylalanyl-tRNA synthetase beta chain